VLLLWIYYSAQIFLLGAEFTRVFAYERGSRVARSPIERAGYLNSEAMAGRRES
jgi:membrane protein